jgi:hypothetical protein
MAKAAVLCGRLSIVVSLSQTLPVAWVPEQLHIAAVRHYVIDDLGQHHAAIMLLEPIDSQRMRTQPRFACPLPAITVTALSRGRPPLFFDGLSSTRIAVPASHRLTASATARA